jgi:hypothetical protein
MEDAMIFVAISILAALTGLYYMRCFTKARDVYDRAECITGGVLLAIISTLSLAASWVGK